jgi:A/G-specific adenine glycosylase
MNSEFTKIVWDFYKQSKRDLPWRKTRDPYKILISEVMLQQTQVDRIVPKYAQFIKTFPDFKSLNKAPLQQVLKIWNGLGYNRRALYLKQAAEQVVKEYNGKLPNSIEQLQTLAGIGYHTAGSISAFAFNKPVVFIETNIRSVFIHNFFHNKKIVSDKQLIPFIERTLDKTNPREWYWALMDYGSYLKKLFPNPSRASKHHVKQSKFEGSDRQIRGVILKLALDKQRLSKAVLYQQLDFTKSRVDGTLQQLMSERLLVVNDATIRIP